MDALAWHEKKILEDRWQRQAEELARAAGLLPDDQDFEKLRYYRDCIANKVRQFRLAYAQTAISAKTESINQEVKKAKPINYDKGTWHERYS